ncbi:hypothetical protein P9112_014156 [Eukaryota sp. TZLM1-RC]
MQLLLVVLVLVTVAHCEIPVSYGSIIKLRHKTNFYLHSHEVKYGTGSHQQSVTCFPEPTDPNSYWLVEAGYTSEPFPTSTVVRCGSPIRLKHVNTGKRLHSHHFTSPLSHQQEVSAFDGDDSGDNWIIECDSKSNGVWWREKPIRLRHEDTGHWLHSHDVGYNAPIQGQREVTCFNNKKDANNLWRAEEGIYFGNIDDEFDDEL